MPPEARGIPLLPAAGTVNVKKDHMYNYKKETSIHDHTEI
jgi:hypothetical protein